MTKYIYCSKQDILPQVLNKYYPYHGCLGKDPLSNSSMSCFEQYASKELVNLTTLLQAQRRKSGLIRERIKSRKSIDEKTKDFSTADFENSSDVPKEGMLLHETQVDNQDKEYLTKLCSNEQDKTSAFVKLAAAVAKRYQLNFAHFQREHEKLNAVLQDANLYCRRFDTPQKYKTMKANIATRCSAKTRFENHCHTIEQHSMKPAPLDLEGAVCGAVNEKPKRDYQIKPTNFVEEKGINGIKIEKFKSKHNTDVLPKPEERNNKVSEKEQRRSKENGTKDSLVKLKRNVKQGNIATYILNKQPHSTKTDLMSDNDQNSLGIQNNLNALTQHLEAEKHKVKELEIKNKKLTTYAKKVKEHLEKARQQLKESATERKELSQRIDENIREADTKEVENIQLRQEVECLKEQLKHREKDVKNLRRKVKQTSAMIDETDMYEDQLRDVYKTLKKYRIGNKDMKAQITSMIKEKDILEEKIGKLEDSMKSYHIRLEGTQKNCFDLRENNKDLMEEKRILKAENVDISTESKIACAALDDLRHEHQMLQEKYGALEKRVNSQMVNDVIIEKTNFKNEETQCNELVVQHELVRPDSFEGINRPNAANQTCKVIPEDSYLSIFNAEASDQRTYPESIFGISECAKDTITSYSTNVGGEMKGRNGGELKIRDDDENSFISSEEEEGESMMKEVGSSSYTMGRNCSPKLEGNIELQCKSFDSEYEFSNSSPLSSPRRCEPKVSGGDPSVEAEQTNNDFNFPTVKESEKLCDENESNDSKGSRSLLGPDIVTSKHLLADIERTESTAGFSGDSYSNTTQEEELARKKETNNSNFCIEGYSTNTNGATSNTNSESNLNMDGNTEVGKKRSENFSDDEKKIQVLSSPQEEWRKDQLGNLPKESGGFEDLSDTSEEDFKTTKYYEKVNNKAQIKSTWGSLTSVGTGVDSLSSKTEAACNSDNTLDGKRTSVKFDKDLQVSGKDKLISISKGNVSEVACEDKLDDQIEVSKNLSPSPKNKNVHCKGDNYVDSKKTVELCLLPDVIHEKAQKKEFEKEGNESDPSVVVVNLHSDTETSADEVNHNKFESVSEMVTNEEPELQLTTFPPLNKPGDSNSVVDTKGENRIELMEIMDIEYDDDFISSEDDDDTKDFPITLDDIFDDKEIVNVNLHVDADICSCYSPSWCKGTNPDKNTVDCGQDTNDPVIQNSKEINNTQVNNIKEEDEIDFLDADIEELILL